MKYMWNLVELIRFTADLYEEGPEEYRRGNALLSLEKARQWKPVTMQVPGPPTSDDNSMLLSKLMPEISGRKPAAAGVIETSPPREEPLVLATDAEVRRPGGHGVAIPPPEALGGPASSKIDVTITDLILRWQEPQAPKVKRNRWVPTPDSVLEYHTFDEYTADCLLKFQPLHVDDGLTWPRQQVGLCRSSRRGRPRWQPDLEHAEALLDKVSQPLRQVGEG